MTPKEIIAKHICGIAGIRIPFAQIIVENILCDLADEGYIITEKTAIPPAEKQGADHRRKKHE